VGGGARGGHRDGDERMGGRCGEGHRVEQEEEEEEKKEEDMVEERTTDVAHYANVSRYVVQRKQTEPEAPTPHTTAPPPRRPVVVATLLLRRQLHK